MKTPKKASWFSRYDKMSYGLIAGTITSFIGFFLNYFFNPYLFKTFVQHWDVYRGVNFGVLGDMLSLALLFPMFLMYFSFFRLKLNEFSRGLLLVILILVICVVIFSVN